MLRRRRAACGFFKAISRLFARNLVHVVPIGAAGEKFFDFRAS